MKYQCHHKKPASDSRGMNHAGAFHKHVNVNVAQASSSAKLHTIVIIRNYSTTLLTHLPPSRRTMYPLRADLLQQTVLKSKV